MAEVTVTKPVLIDVAKIRPNPWNPNKMTDEKFAQAVENVRRFGFNGATLLRKLDEPEGDVEYEIVDGEHRWRAATELSLKAIPCIVREFTTAEAKAQTLAMNEIRGTMDPEKVAQLVREIDEEGIGRDDFLAFSGFTADELDKLDVAFAATADPDPKGASDQSDQVHDGYYVMVTCLNEASQLSLAEKLEAEGFETRLVVA